MRKKYKSTNLKLIIVLLLFIVTIGYATLQTSLTINGTSKINNSTWNVHFADVSVTNGSVSIDSEDNTQYAAHIDSNDNTKVAFSVVFNEPGDFYEFTVKVVNDGSIDAMIDDFTKTLKINGTTQDSIPAWLNYTVTYSDGVAIAKNQILEHGKFETYKVRVEFIRDITNAQFNEAKGKTLTFEYEVDYIQKGEGAVPVSGYTDVYSVANLLYVGSVLPDNAIVRSTPELAMADWGILTGVEGESLPYFIKYKMNQNRVLEEISLGFVVSDESKARWKSDKCDNDAECEAKYDNMVNGTYYIRGLNLYNSNSATCKDEYKDDLGRCFNPYYESNINVIKTAYNYDVQPDVCYYYNDNYGESYACYIDDIGFVTSRYGSLFSADNGSTYNECSFLANGESYCTHGTSS